MANASQTESRAVDPTRLAELTLAAAVRADADAVYIEPTATSEESYVITLERSGDVLVSLPV